MFVKRYIANDMSEAMEKIRKELGPEAVILSHRTMRKKGMPGLFKKKLVEVMVAYEPAPDRSINVNSQPVQTVSEPALAPEKQPTAAPQPVATPQPVAGPQPVSGPQPIAAAQLTTRQPAVAAQQAVASVKASQYYLAATPLIAAQEQEEAAQQMRGVMQYQQAATQVRYAPVSASIPQGAPILFTATQAAQSDAGAAEQAETAFETLDFPRLTAVKENAAEPADDAKIDELNTKLAELKTVVRSLSAKIISVDRDSLLQFSPEVMQIYNTFLEQDIQEELARSLCDKIQELSEHASDSPEDIAEMQLLSLLGRPAPVKAPRNARTIIMLTGPSGVGKTTTLVKLAGMYTLKEGLRVGFINTDTYRVAAQQQLQVYADILDIPCCTVYAPDEIPVAMHTLSDCDVVLIDTAGKSMADRWYQEELCALIQQSGASEVLLHVSASMSVNACQELIYYYSFLDNYRLVITKLDEVAAWGNIINIVAYAKKPLAFVTVGQKVPQDIEVPDVMNITSRILGREGV